MTKKITRNNILNILYGQYAKDHSEVFPEKELTHRTSCEPDERAGAIIYLVQKKLIRRAQFFDSFRWTPKPSKKITDFFPNIQLVARQLSSNDLKLKQDCDVARKKDGLENEQFYVKISAKSINAIENEEA